MELLLNIFWLALTVPAIWVARHNRACGAGRGFGNRVWPVLLLACVLLLLFPVISASDDLHPMRAEMEESNPFKRVLKQVPGNCSGIWVLALAFIFVRGASLLRTSPVRQICSFVVPKSLFWPEDVVLSTGFSRAPPCPCLG